MEENSSVIAPAAASPVTDVEKVRHEERGGGGGKREENHEAEVGDGGEISNDSVEVSEERKRRRTPSDKLCDDDDDDDEEHINNDNNNNNGILPMSSPPGFSSTLLNNCVKRGRGRPPGTGRLQLLASLGGFVAETAGGVFIPHVISVDPGEDIASKISSFAQRGPRAVCILSATGVVSSVVIRQPGSSGGLLRFEGCFEILSLSGSFTFSETSGARRKICMLTVSLAKPDGQVFGGSVIGYLIASGPIQLIVASFKQNISKEIKLRQPAESSTCSLLGNSETVKLSFQIPGIRDGSDQENNSTAQKSDVSECGNEESGNRIFVNQLLKPVAERVGGQKGSQSPQNISGQKISADINVCNRQI